MQRRGEISMEVIIIAAIALLALVILSVLLIRSGIIFGKGTACEGVGGTCVDGGPTECSIDSPPSAHACGEGRTCCLPLIPQDDA